MHRRAIVQALAVLALAGAGTAVAQQREPYLRSSVELGLKVPAEIERLEVATTDARRTRPERGPVTDLLLRLTPGSGAVDVALQLANGQRQPAGHSLFRAEVYAVTGGRIVRDVHAGCDHWQDDVALCRIDCEGGTFGLRRRLRGANAGLTLIVGRLPRGDHDPERPGFGLGSCGGVGPVERAIVPKAGRPVVELQLTEE